jgi:poly [ADP-ribose] polymerase 7/11/12/13
MGNNHNEKWLFHGTKPESVEKIVKEGFDFRLYGTAVGAKYGKGSYFAVKSSYSKNYSPPDANNIRRMLLVRVCVGRVAPEPGKPELTRPPLDPQGQLYDSVTDNPKEPQMYVIFDNNQCYPAYVIEFKSG